MEVDADTPTYTLRTGAVEYTDLDGNLIYKFTAASYVSSGDATEACF